MRKMEVIFRNKDRKFAMYKSQSFDWQFDNRKNETIVIILNNVVDKEQFIVYCLSRLTV